jgi:hypothetical protein
MVRWIAIGLIVLAVLLVVADEVLNPAPFGTGENWVQYRQLHRVLVLCAGTSAMAGAVTLYLSDRRKKRQTDRH